MRRLSLVGALLALALTGIAGASSIVTIGEKQANTTVTVHRGDTLVVVLAGNATTGYVWQVQSVKAAVLRYLDTDYVPSPHAPGVVGSGGKYRLTFKAVASGATVLRLRYARVHKGAETGDAYEVKIKVTT